jgi:hypothetical protein
MEIVFIPLSSIGHTDSQVHSVTTLFGVISHRFGMKALMIPSGGEPMARPGLRLKERQRKDLMEEFN